VIVVVARLSQIVSNGREDVWAKVPPMTADAAPAADIQPKAKIFISYSRKDMAFADRLEVALKERGFEVLIDRQEIYAFEPWWERIQALIGRADTIVFVLSPDAVGSDVALKEVAYAASLNKRFAPIVCRRVENSAVPDALRRLNFIVFDDPGQFETSADRLAEALQTDIVWIRDHTKFGETTRAWVAAGGPNGMLLRTPALEMAEYWIASRPRGAPTPTSEIVDFIAQSRKATLGARRLRRITLVSVFGLMIAVILVLVAWINQDYLVRQWHYATMTLPYWYTHVRGHVLTAAQERTLMPEDAFKECVQDCPEMIVLPSGSFMMGGPDMIEQPLHTVTLVAPFAVSKYELTFADWDACVTGGGCGGYIVEDLGWGRGRQPVINTNWYDAQQYVAWLSQVTGKTYRLLSEAEYEYAARAGSTTAFPWGDDIKLNGQAMANCNGCGSKWDNSRPAPVGSFPPNKFGLYDMVGNVFKWTQDCVHNNYKGAPTDGSTWTEGGVCGGHVIRGGSGHNPPGALRSAARSGEASGNRTNAVGFRVARTLDTR
jgi:formylglycine-generating enzyme required for sulfatase activity